MKIKSYVSNFVQKISSSDGTFTQALNLAETHNVGFVNISSCGGNLHKKSSKVEANNYRCI